MAIKALTWMLRTFEPPVYCYHQIVHNRLVVEAFERAGVRFVDDIEQVPPGAPLMLSAHGSAPEVIEAAQARTGLLVDAVCPLVTKVHHQVRRLADDDYRILYVGHQGHDEAVGTLAVAPAATTLVEPDASVPQLSADRVALVAQTTLGLFEWQQTLAATRRQYPAVWTAKKSDLCYATTNRQSAVEELARRADLVLVVGSEASSNTQALVRVARELGVRAERVEGPEDLTAAMLKGAEVIGVTAGASAPEAVVTTLIDALAPTQGIQLVTVTAEDEYFPLPRQLRGALGAVEAAVAAGLGLPPAVAKLADDRTWSATAALASLVTVN